MAHKSASTSNVVTGSTKAGRGFKPPRLTRKKGLALLVTVVVLAAAGGGAWWYFVVRNAKGKINVNTYPWSKTAKGEVKDQIKNMNDQQRADYFYNVAFEYKNTNKPDDAQAAIKVSLQYQRTEKALLLAAGLAEGRHDYAAAIAYYQEVIQLLSRQSGTPAKTRASQFQKRIEDLRKLQQKPVAPPPAKNPSEVSA